MKKNYYKIEYLHPSGQQHMPNGLSIQRGGWLNVAHTNKNKLILDSLAPELYGLSDYKGGIILFPAGTDIKAVSITHWLSQTFENNNKNKKIKQIVNELDLMGVKKVEQIFCVKNLFGGEWQDIDNQLIYNIHSISLSVFGLSTKSLLTLASLLASIFNQKRVLLYDANTKNIYNCNPL